MRCKNCGSENAVNATICSNCGANLIDKQVRNNPQNGGKKGGGIDPQTIKIITAVVALVIIVATILVGISMSRKNKVDVEETTTVVTTQAERTTKKQYKPVTLPPTTKAPETTTQPTTEATTEPTTAETTTESATTTTKQSIVEDNIILE